MGTNSRLNVHSESCFQKQKKQKKGGGIKIAGRDFAKSKTREKSRETDENFDNK